MDGFLVRHWKGFWGSGTQTLYKFIWTGIFTAAISFALWIGSISKPHFLGALPAVVAFLAHWELLLLGVWIGSSLAVLTMLFTRRRILQPQIVFDRAEEIYNEGDFNFYTHLWFRNQTSSGAARDVVALIDWRSESSGAPLSLTAKWREVPYNTGPTIYAQNRIDLLPDDQSHALDLCIRHPDATDSYALSIESPYDPFAASRRLTPGTYDVVVKLSCSEAKCQFRFKVQIVKSAAPIVRSLDQTLEGVSA